MIELTKPEVIITHESDLDGFIAGVLLQRLARKLFQGEIPLQTYHNHNWRQRPLTEKAAWVTDLAFEARLDKPNWVVIDHHPTAHQPRQATLIHDATKSAGLLCYELVSGHGLANEKLDRLVRLNNVADLFLTKDPEFVLANDYANLVKNYQFWNLLHLIQGELEHLIEHPLLKVMEVKRQVEDPLGYAWSKANMVEITPTIGFVETVVGNSNMIVHQLLEKGDTPYSVLITAFRRINATVVLSLRSRHGEAIQVAEKLQGGGHANACGATLPRSVQSIADGIHYLRQALHPQKSFPADLKSLEAAFAELEPKR